MRQAQRPLFAKMENYDLLELPFPAELIRSIGETLKTEDSSCFVLVDYTAGYDKWKGKSNTKQSD